MASQVSFTVRRPTPASREHSSGPESDGGFKVPALPRHVTGGSQSAPRSPLARSSASSPRNGSKPITYFDGQLDSSDEEDDQDQDELVTGFDRFGVERKDKPKKAAQVPLVIPALQNRDWREVARKRRSAKQYVPAAGKAETGADGSVGGLGTRDQINSGPQLVGLHVPKREDAEEDDAGHISDDGADVKMEAPTETEDEAALRAILSGVNGGSGNTIADILPAPLSEKEALKQDVGELPESASISDYNRVPIEQFGAALLRGMGWKEGTAATRKPGKGLVQPYLPESRPALLGIGAKEREPLDDGSTKKKGRPDKKYVPLVKQERESSSRDKKRDRSRSPRRETRSRRSSRSPDGRRREHGYDDDQRGSSRRDHRESRDGHKDRERDRDSSDRRRDYSHRDGRRGRSRERGSSSKRGY